MSTEEEMEKKKKKKKKGFISEEDVSLLLQRYNPTAIIALLQEISRISGPRIDWNALVKRTATGITSARECQMLWRHLAYRDVLLKRVEDGAEPLDDDSDLEFELEAVPAATGEALSEAVSCVKVLMSSSLTCEPGLTNRTTIETPLTTSVANDQSTCVPSDKQQLANHVSHATFPSSIHKRTLSTGASSEGLDVNGPALSYPPKKKRKLWSKDEDMKLIAAVQESGEGNWAIIAKSVFKHDRTASQLSQRWAILRKKDANLASSGSKLACSTRSEERLATQKAIFLALDMPKTGRLSAILSGAAQPVTPASSMTLSAAKSDALPISEPQPVNQLNQPIQTKLKKVTLNPSNKLQTTSKVQVAPVQPSEGQKSLIKAAAFAAGGRLATPSTAASFFRAAQSKNAVHIRPGGDAKPSSPITNVKLTPAATSAIGPRATGFVTSRPSAAISSQPVANSVSAPTGQKNGGQQKQGCPGKLAINPDISSTGATNHETLLESNSASASCVDGKTDNVTAAIIAEELVAEGVKGSENIVLHGSAIQSHDMPSLDMSVKVSNGHIAQETIHKPIDPLKANAIENQNVDARAVTPDAEAAEGNDMEIDASENHIGVVEGTKPFDYDSRKSALLDSVNAQDRTIDEEQLAVREVDADGNKKRCIKDDQNVLSEHNAPDINSPADG